MTWFIIAYNRKDMLNPSVWQGEGYGNMQKAMNELYDTGYKNFDVWEADKPNVKYKMYENTGAS